MSKEDRIFGKRLNQLLLTKGKKSFIGLRIFFFHNKQANSITNLWNKNFKLSNNQQILSQIILFKKVKDSSN